MSNDGIVPFEFNGPPEPVIKDDTVHLVHPETDKHGDQIELKETKLAIYECARCGVQTETKIRNGQIQQPGACNGCERNGPFIHPVLEEYPNINPSTYANPQWYTPTGISNDEYQDLWSDVREWIYQNWVAHEDHLYDGLTAFAISSWLRPNYNFLPQLMVMGKHETGKTRLLTTLARICYRSRVPVSFTPAAIFRTIDKYDITLFLSEYHDINQDLRDEINAVIKGSQKRGEDVMRTQKGPDGSFEPASFDIFTHVAIGTQFDPPDDIISRCIKIQTKPADRDVPVWFDDDQAGQLRNRLLFTRYKLLDSNEWREAEQRSLEWLNDHDINGRLREKLLSLVTVADHWNKRDSLKPFIKAQKEQAEEASAESDDALVVQAILDLALEEVETIQTIGDANPWQSLAIPLSDIADRFNNMTGRDVSSQYLGQVRKRLDLDKSRHSDGVVIQDEKLKTKLQQLCNQNNLEWEASGVHERIRELDEDEKYRSTCSECGEHSSLTHRDAVEGHHMCSQCASAIDDLS